MIANHEGGYSMASAGFEPGISWSAVSFFTICTIAPGGADGELSAVVGGNYKEITIPVGHVTPQVQHYRTKNGYLTPLPPPNPLESIVF